MEHFYQNIQGWTSFENLYRQVVQEAPDGSRFAEVGCWLGRSAAFMGVEIINSKKDLELYCIDHWKGSIEHENVPKDLFEQFKQNIEPVSSVVIPTKGDSAAMAHHFPDGDFYFVFVDAGHEYADVVADITAWLPKVQKGGILAGDDYSMDGVKAAVDELLPHCEISATSWPWWWVRV